MSNMKHHPPKWILFLRSEYHNDDFIQEVIANRVDGIAAVNEDKKMRNIARALNDEEIMEKIMANGYPDD